MSVFIIIIICVLFLSLAMYNGIITLQVEINGKRYDESQILEIFVMLILSIPLYLLECIIKAIKKIK